MITTIFSKYRQLVLIFPTYKPDPLRYVDLPKPNIIVDWLYHNSSTSIFVSFSPLSFLDVVFRRSHIYPQDQ